MLLFFKFHEYRYNLHVLYTGFLKEPLKLFPDIFLVCFISRLKMKIDEQVCLVCLVGIDSDKVT